MKATEKWFLVVLLMMLCNVFLTFANVNKKLRRDLFKYKLCSVYFFRKVFKMNISWRFAAILPLSPLAFQRNMNR